MAWCLLATLLLSSAADAIYTYENSQLIDLSDLTYTNGMGFSCPGTGCTLYTTKQIASGKDIGIFEGSTLRMTLDQVYAKKDGYLVGRHLTASTSYRVKTTKNGTPVEAFILYIVADIAGTHAVTEFGVGTTIELDASGMNIVTILNANSGVTFSKFFGKAAPMIYAVGFDSIETCKPVFVASSVDNAARSEITVYSALTTIVFGSTDNTNRYHVATVFSSDYEYIHLNPVGSAIVSTPGYKGCPYSPNDSSDNKQIKYKISMSGIGKIDVKLDDMYISVDNELTLIAGNKDTKQEVDFIWQPMGTYDYFHAQVDQDGPSLNDDQTWLYVILGMLGVAVLIASIFCLYCAYRIYVRKIQKSRDEILDEVIPDDVQYEKIHKTNADSDTAYSTLTPVPPISSSTATPVVVNTTAPVQSATALVKTRKFLSVVSIDYSSKFLNDYEIIKIRGGFGCVFEAANKYDNGVQIRHALGEVRALALLDHPNIVRYNSTWVEKPPAGFQHSVDAEFLRMMGLTSRSLMNYDDDSIFIYIQMQLCNYSLSDWLKENIKPDSRPLSRMKAWFTQIVSAPSNVLFAGGNTLKVCDLGIATERRDNDATAVTRSSIGTALYMSPEQHSYSRYSSKSDVFTLGLILAELCVVMTPTARFDIFNNFRSGQQCDFIEDERTAEFIRMLTQYDPKNRPSCREMLDHLFLA